jgi:hypothetical protein
MYTNIHIFFTTWYILLVIFHKTTIKYINLLYLSFVVLIGGLYISYIHPRQYKLIMFNDEYKLEDSRKFILVDMFFHIMAFIFVYSKYKSYYTPIKIDMQLMASIGLICLYSLIINVKDVYSIRLFELMTILVLATLSYFLLFDKK